MATTTVGTADSDANQKRRRYRGGRTRRLWKQWSTQNPTLATLLVLFVGLSLCCMTLEYFGNSQNRSALGQRMRRAKVLLKEAHRQQQQQQQQREDDQNEEEAQQQSRKQKGGMKRRHGGAQEGAHPTRYEESDVQELLDKMDHDIVNNFDGGVRWTAPYLLLPPIVSPAVGRQLQQQTNNDDQEMTRGRRRKGAVNPRDVDVKSEFFRVKRRFQKKMAWEDEFYQLLRQDDDKILKPPVDYVTHAYDYPKLLWELPDLHDREEYPSYPPLKSLGDLMKAWPQDNDFPGAHQRPIPEGLLHFNYSNPEEREMARKFRDAELPFKLYDVPEVTAATQKWTDEYVTENFDGSIFMRGRKTMENGNLLGRLFGKTKTDKTNGDKGSETPAAHASGLCQESPNNFFAFFQPNLWDVKTMGLPPVRNNDWTFEHWSKHARYADAVGLNASKPHFYWQSGVPREERLEPKSSWTFISRDLPSFSSPTETFFVFEPESQKGIQCRFGERGVVAATHYDSGRNMIAMVTGAKRYILAPPKECASLGIVPWKFNAEFRHSLLNFGHINYLNETASSNAAELDDGEEAARGGHDAGDDVQRKRRQWKGDHMSEVEREWMEIAASSKAIETVLKAGEVLYIPSHWFHYIISLQKSAQCNVRSGVHDEGTPAFGGKLDVKTCGRLSQEEAALH